MAEPVLIPTRCAICGTGGNAAEIYSANFEPGALNPAVFSARRLPDGTHFRIVRCAACGLVRSDPVAPPEVLAGLYAQSSFDYGDEVPHLRSTYGGYLSRLVRLGANPGALLEIGCGDGFFLEEALARGFASVQGVEPSRQAREQASPHVREQIVCDVMRPGLFPADSFDVVCMFQTLDHVSEPRALLAECRRVLKPGGWMMCINHNVSAVSARLLGERSPVVDIEHTYLYSPATQARLFGDCGFDVRCTGSVWNRYSVRYLVHLAPLAPRLKGRVLDFLERSVLGRLSLRVPLGNLFLMARKPD